MFGDASSGAERRVIHRPRTALECEVIHGQWRERHAGTVRNIHDGGARVRLSCHAERVADPVELKVGSNSYQATIAWRSEREIGLRFNTALDSEEDRQLADLRAILQEMRASGLR